MRKVLFLLMLITSVVFIVVGCKEEGEFETGKIYVIDSEMMHLIPIDINIRKTGIEDQAEFMLSSIIKGYDHNPKIRRLVPDIKGCMSVKVNNKTAIVDIKNKMIKNHPKGRDLEQLTVYSIVNTLTSLDEIDNVRFTINGKVKKDFMGYLDMRNSFRFEDVV